MEGESFSNLLVNDHLTRSEWSEVDANLFVNLVYGTLEQYQLMSHFLQQVSRRPLKRIDPAIRTLLLISIYQLMNFDRIPDYAVVNEAVKLSRKKQASASGFVNGILRNVIRQKDELKKSIPMGMDSDALSLRFSYPKWIIKELKKEYDGQVVLNILKASQTAPNIFIRCNLLRCHVEELIVSLQEDGVIAEKSKWVPEAVKIIKSVVNLTHTKAYKMGWFQIQSISSMLTVEMMNPRPGERILDMAAAPGGKSLFMAERMNNNGLVLARDLSEDRLKQLKQHQKRMGITIIKTQIFDATQKDSELQGEMDKVLLDAPCSSLGMIRRKPEIKFTINNKGVLMQRAALQFEMLNRAAEFVKLGGHIVYSTCTLFSYENQDVINLFLEKNPQFQLEPEGMRSLNPAMNTDLDGFFMAKLQRVE